MTRLLRPRARPGRLLLVCAVLLLGAGRGSGQSVPLTVFAASSLTGAFRELADSLRRRDPGLAVTFNFAGSQALVLQLREGARADLFASADERWMADAMRAGLVAGAAAVFARNRLVLVVPKANPARIEGLGDLHRQGIRLVLAADAVPAGRYARAALRAFGGADGSVPRFAELALANVVSDEENVRAVLAKVQLGEADAGIVYQSDVTGAAANAVRVFPVPPAADLLAVYPVALLRGATQAPAARRFLDLLLSPVGQGVLRRHGFLPVGERP